MATKKRKNTDVNLAYRGILGIILVVLLLVINQIELVSKDSNMIAFLVVGITLTVSLLSITRRGW